MPPPPFPCTETADRTPGDPSSPGRPSARARSLAALLAPLLLFGCDGDASGEGSSAPADASAPEGSAAAAPGPEVLDREFVFVSSGADTATAVAWLFRARPGGDRVFREWRAWGGRGGRWEALLASEGVTPRAGTPWRVLPGAGIVLTVGPGDQVSSIALRDPGRALEMELEELLTEWTGPGGRAVRLQRGTVRLSTGEEEGFVIEVARSWRDPGEGPGDWIFVHAGDRMQLFLSEETPLASPRSPAGYRGWSRIAFRDGQWPRVTIDWPETRSFESARRDIPAVWELSSPGGEIEGRLEAAGQHLSAGPGRGPLLPVLALFEVEGTLRLQGEPFQVRGIVSHRQR